MSEDDFRHELRRAMAVVTAPPSMSEVPVLEAGRRALRRRRAALAGVATAVAVAAIAVGVVVTVPGGTSGGVSPAERSTQSRVPFAASPGPGQSGALSGLLAGTAPPGYTTDVDGLSGHDAAHRYRLDGHVIWRYDANVPLGKGDRVGRLAASVLTAGNPVSKPGCKPAGPGGSCNVMTIDGRSVLVYSIGRELRVNYEYPDGTMVFLEQDLDYRDSGKPGFATPPLSRQRLAELAADPRFHLD